MTPGAASPSDPPIALSAWRRRILIGATVIVLATLVAYLPVLVEGGFIWDDDDYVTRNELLLDLDGLRRIWIPRQTHQYYPLVFSTFWIEHKLWNLDPRGYHVVNVLLHIANALLLWSVCHVLRIPGAWMIGAVFALHPVNVESVAWITERKNVLSTACYLLAALSYLRFDSMRFEERRALRESLGWHGLSLVLFIMALLSKTVTCSLPAALILAMLWQRRRLTVARLAWLVPMFMIGLALALHTAHIERINVGAVGPEFQFTLVQRLLIACNALLFYPWKMLWPHPLLFIYERWPIDAPTIAMWLAIPAVVLIGAGAIVAFIRGWRGVPLALAFFAGTIFPALGFFNVYPMRYSFVADHFQYLAGIGIIAAVVGGLTPLLGRMRPLPYILAACVLGVLGGLTWLEGPEYAGAEALWRATIAHNPQAWMARNNLAALLIKRGEALQAAQRPDEAHALLNEAKSHAIEALRFKRDHHTAEANLASALRLQGRLDEALPHAIRAYDLVVERENQLGEHLRERRLVKADYPFSVGVILYKLDRLEESELWLKRALDLDPADADSNYFMGLIEFNRGNVDAAKQRFNAVLARQPGNMLARRFLADQARKERDCESALVHYRVLADHADDPAMSLHGAIGLADLLVSCPDESLRDYGEAAAIAETLVRETGGMSPQVLDVLAKAYAGSGRMDDAIQVQEAAARVAREQGLLELAAQYEEKLAELRRR
jgi:tetratricopeptide (TPR) repeat protein